MKVALVGITKQGIKKAHEVEQALTKLGHEVTFFVPDKHSNSTSGGKTVLFHQPLSELMGELMAKHEAVVCIMALGIVVRIIAPFLKCKRSDPAVVVLDETGQNVVSVLAGHWGGANDLTRNLAKEIEANPVITTATDVWGLPAVEMLAKERGWVIENFSLVRKINSAIVNGDEVQLYCDQLLNIELPENIKRYPVKDFSEVSGSLKVVVTNKILTVNSDTTLFLRPKNLIVGIGCQRGVSQEQIQAAVTAGLNKGKLAFDSIKDVTSIDLKADEPALLAFADKWQVPIKFFSREEIREFFIKSKLQELASSNFVKEKIGVDGVCEPTALMAAGKRGKIIVPKTILNGVTIAIAEAI